MTQGTKHLTPIRRGERVTHDQLVEHWRTKHSPGVKALMRPARYSVTFFDPRDGRAAYDGMAAIAYDTEADWAAHNGRNTPQAVVEDGFVDLVRQPMERMTAVENVIVAGPGDAPATAAEREAAFKMTFLVSVGPGQDLVDVQRHWLELHAPNVASNFQASGGVRYVVNLAATDKPQPFAGIAELWYRDRDAALAHRIADDGFNAKTTGIPLPGKEWIVTYG